MKIAFHTNQINLLGVEVSIFEYADLCEKLFGYKSIILSKNNRIKDIAASNINQPLALKKFRDRFPLFLYEDLSQIEDILNKQNVNLFYAQKRGDYDKIESKKIKTVIHSVFKYHDPHGSVYAYISKWLSDIMTDGKAPFVPYPINLPKASNNLRSNLNIPPDAVVFGRYGGPDSFNVSFVQDLILELVNKNCNVHFLFMNTKDFLNKSDTFLNKIKVKIKPITHKQIHFIPPTASLAFKSEFINTCDAMIHARDRGETFGAAVGEFSIHNCPVITYGGNSNPNYESAHIQMLGEKCFIYNNYDELSEIFRKIICDKNVLKLKNWNAYSDAFNPIVVMNKFKKVFIDS